MGWVLSLKKRKGLGQDNRLEPEPEPHPKAACSPTPSPHHQVGRGRSSPSLSFQTIRSGWSLPSHPSQLEGVLRLCAGGETRPGSWKQRDARPARPPRRAQAFFSRQWWGSLTNKTKPTEPVPTRLQPFPPPKTDCRRPGTCKAQLERARPGRRPGWSASPRLLLCQCVGRLPRGRWRGADQGWGRPWVQAGPRRKPVPGGSRGQPRFPEHPQGCYITARQGLLLRCAPGDAPSPVRTKQFPPPNLASCKEIEGGGGSQMSCK